MVGFALIASLTLPIAWMSGGQGKWRGHERAAAQSHEIARAAHGDRGRPASRLSAKRISREPHRSARLKAGTGSVLKVRSGRVLATVNGTPIRLEHLAALRHGDEMVTMTKQVFRTRMNRAIEAELVFQEASARGIGFSKRQQARLDRIAPRHEADLTALNPYGITWDSLSEEDVDLKRRLMESMLLRQNLVATSNGLAPSANRTNQALYETALARMMAQLKARATIVAYGVSPGPVLEIEHSGQSLLRSAQLGIVAPPAHCPADA